MSPKRKRWLRVGLAITVIGVVSVLFARTLRANWSELSERDLSLGWWAVVATLAFAGAVAVSGLLWGRIIRDLDRPVAPVEAVRVHFASWLLKYIPGQVGFVVNKVAWADRNDRSRTMALISVVYENAFLLLGSTVPMLGILVVARAGSTEISTTIWLALAAIIPLAVLMHPAVFRGTFQLLGTRRLGRALPEQYVLPTSAVLRHQVAYLIPRLVNGVGVVVVAVALVDAPADSWIPLGAAYALAGAIGILAIFVPSGLGVRESVFVLFAAPYIGADGAALVAIATRVLATLADGMLAITLAVLKLRFARERSPA